MKILFLHDWTPGGSKPSCLKDHRHDVLNPALPDDDFEAAVRIAQAEYDQGKPDVVVGGFWVFVYGLMVFLPACTVPGDRGAKPPRWWHYPVAIVLPILAAIPVVPLVVLLRQWLGIELFPGA
ncbi:MAG: hypothetical protein ACYC0X_19830 [Pirellulaceae bacterium]